MTDLGDSHVSQKRRDLGHPSSVGHPISGDFITLARVVKTQGRIGEVAAESHTDVPDRFRVGMKLSALAKSGDARRNVEIEDLWPHKGLVVLKFVGIDSINDAEPLIGSELQVPSADRAELEQGWNYISDLVGSVVLDAGQEIGTIEDVQSGAGEAPLLIVAGADGKKYDVPFAEAYLEKVDLKERQVRMKLPGGLLEVNAPLSAEEKKQSTRPRRKKA